MGRLAKAVASFDRDSKLCTLQRLRKYKSSVENRGGVDIPARVLYRTAVMNQRALTSDRPSAADPHVGATGGLYVVALFYLGYAYVYSYLLTAGGL